MGSCICSFARGVTVEFFCLSAMSLVPGSPGRLGTIQPSPEPTGSCWTSESLLFPAGRGDQTLKLAADFLVAAEDLPEHPYWPKGDSGITIGVGWHLGYHNQQDFLKTWAALDSETAKKLQVALGKRGGQAERVAHH